MKILKFFRARYTEAWWQLSPEDRQAHYAKVATALEQVGGKPIVMATPYWADEQWVVCGVEEFPSLEAQMQHAQMLFEISHARYMLGETWLATKYPLE